MKCGRCCLIHYAKETIQIHGCTILRVKLSENYKYNDVALIQLILQTVSEVQTHVRPTYGDHARYCVLVRILQVVTNKIYGIIGNFNCGSSNIIYDCECFQFSK